MGKSLVKGATFVAVRKRFVRRLIFAVGITALLWISFFDSHSFVKRFKWHAEQDELRTENALLSEEIERLERELEKGLSDEVAEAVAREQYGMRRPGETVYRVEALD